MRALPSSLNSVFCSDRASLKAGMPQRRKTSPRVAGRSLCLPVSAGEELGCGAAGGRCSSANEGEHSQNEFQWHWSQALHQVSELLFPHCPVTWQDCKMFPFYR